MSEKFAWMEGVRGRRIALLATFLIVAIVVIILFGDVDDAVKLIETIGEARK